jgi:sirohydrochlorin ferrochelatase
VSHGAEQIVVLPFFLGPGKHWTQDIPQLTAAAAAKFPGTRFQVAAPLGIDDLMLDLLEQRLQECLAAAASSGAPSTNDSKTTV